jgi:hypothetical protein
VLYLPILKSAKFPSPLLCGVRISGTIFKKSHGNAARACNVDRPKWRSWRSYRRTTRATWPPENGVARTTRHESELACCEREMLSQTHHTYGITDGLPSKVSLAALLRTASVFLFIPLFHLLYFIPLCFYDTPYILYSYPQLFSCAQKSLTCWGNCSHPLTSSCRSLPLLCATIHCRRTSSLLLVFPR